MVNSYTTEAAAIKVNGQPAAIPRPSPPTASPVGLFFKDLYTRVCQPYAWLISLLAWTRNLGNHTSELTTLSSFDQASNHDLIPGAQPARG